MSNLTSQAGRRFKSRKFRNRLSRTMLIVLLPITLIPVLIIGAVTYLRASELLQEQVTTQLISTVQSQSKRLRSWTRRKQIRLDLAARHTAVTQAAASLIQGGLSETEHTRLREQTLATIEDRTQRDRVRHFHQFILTDLNGTVLLASEPGLEGLNLADHPSVENTFHEHSTVAALKAPPFYEDGMALITSHPVLDPHGEPVAILLGITRSTDLLRQLEGSSIPIQFASLYLFVGGDPFVGFNPYRTDFAEFTPSVDQSRTLLELQDQGEFQTIGRYLSASELTTHTGLKVFGAYTWLPENRLGLGIEIPRQAVVGQLNTLTTFSISLLAALLTLVSLITWAGTRMFSRPIQLVADTIQQFSEGERTRRVPVNRNDEIGYLGDSFNQMADQLTRLYQSLEDQVEERSQQIRTAAEIARTATSANTMDEILNRTVELIVERLDFVQASIYLVETGNQFAALRASADGHGLHKISLGQTVPVGSPSLIGQVTIQNQPQVHNFPMEPDSAGSDSELSEENRRAAIPIALGEQVLGALEVRMAEGSSFDPETITVMQFLADQIASAIHNIYLLETAQIDLREATLVTRLSREVSRAEDEASLYSAVLDGLRHSTFTVLFYRSEPEGCRLIADPVGETHGPSRPDTLLSASQEALIQAFSTGSRYVLVEGDNPNQALPALQELLTQSSYQFVAAFLIQASNQPRALLVLGAQQQSYLAKGALQPYVGLVEMITNALEKIDARRATQMRTLHLEIVSDISREVNRSLNLDELLKKAIDLIRDRFGYYHTSVFLLDRSGQEAIIRQSTGEIGERMVATGFSIDVGSQSVVGYVATHGHLLLLNDVSGDPRYVPDPHLPETRSEIAIPLQTGDRILGVLDVQSRAINAFSPEDQRVLQSLADQMAIAVANAELFQEANETLSRHRMLHQVTSAAAASTSLEDALATTAQGLQATLGGDHQVSIYLYDPKKKTLELGGAAGAGWRDFQRIRLPLASGIPGWVATNQEALRLDDVQADPRRTPETLEVASALALPLIYRGDLLGVLQAESQEQAAYDENDQELLITLGNTLAAIIANTRMIERQRVLFEVTNKIRRSATVQTVLETTVNELGSALGLSRAQLKIGIANIPDQTVSNLEESNGQNQDSIDMAPPTLDGGEARAV